MTGRRTLLAGALALPAGRALASGERLRVSVPQSRLPEFLQVFRAFAESRPDLLFEMLVRDDDHGLAPTEILGAIRAGRPPVDAVLTDLEGLAWGMAAGFWRTLPGALRAAGEGVSERLARMMRPLAGEEAVLVSADPGGPLLLHQSSANPPRSAAGLLEYARANPGRFLYPRPSESALGQQFLMVLPHLLRDRDPLDAQTGWARSWEFLEELDRHIDYYPTDDGAALEDVAAGEIDLLPASLTALLRGRLDGLLPPDIAFSTFEGAPLLPQGLFLTMPRPAGEHRLGVVEPFLRFLLEPTIQAGAFGRGLLPAAPDLGMGEAAPRTHAERAGWRSVLATEEAERIAAVPLAPPVPPYQMAYMIRRWEERIGARHGERR